MPVEKRNISISFGKGIDTKTDPNQVMAGTPLALTNATLSKTLALQKRNGYQPTATFNTAVASSSLTNQKLGTFNDQLLTIDGKTLSSLGNPQNVIIDNFIAAQPTVSIIQREATPIINQDAVYNANFKNTAYTWSSSCVAPNFQQLSFSSATAKFQITAPDGVSIASTGIFGFVKNKVFSLANNFIWTGINYATSALAYYKLNANGSSANFTQTAIGSVGADFSANANPLGFNRYQRYDGAVLGDNLYLAYFTPATSSITLSLLSNAGVTASTSFKADASGALSLFGDKDLAWITYHDGASSAGFAVLSTSSLQFQGGPNPWFTTDTPSSSNQVSIPQSFTGISKGFSANVYTQWINYYPPLQAPGTLPWPSAQRTDFISRQSLSNVATSGSSAIVARSVGLASKAFNYLGDDFLFASYGIQTSTSADRLEPTNFLICPTKQTNNIVGKLAFENACGYDFATGGQSNFLNNNYGSVGYGLPLPNVTTTDVNSQFVIPYLIKTAAITLSSTSIVDRFFISFNYGLNSCNYDFNANTLNTNQSFGNNSNIAGGYLTSFDGKNVTEQNFHLFPEDVQLIGSSSFGPPANTYAYQVIYESQDAQGNIFRSAPSKTYSITTQGSSAIYLSIPTSRLTNRKNTVIRVYRNAPTIDNLTFHDIAPLTPAMNNPNVDNVVVIDANLDSSIVGNPDIYTTGGVLEDTGAPSPLWISTYKLRLMMTDAENQNTIWYSKEVIPGAPIEMTDLQNFYVSSRYGAIVAHIEMDDKFIIFTSTGSTGAIYYMTGQGPNALGGNNDFSLPTLISTTLTTDNPLSVVLTPDGIMFSGENGIWVLGSNLQLDNIGAPVEAFDASEITSATLIPNATEVRFTLASGVCLVWDYYQRQWYTFANIRATHGLVYQGLFTYLSQQNQAANILQETTGRYADVNTPILISTTLSWLSFAGLQGYQRALKLYVMSTYQSSHLLNVSIAYDFNPSAVQTAVINPTANKNKTWGAAPAWGATHTWGGSGLFTQNRVNLTRQKCQAIQITLQETLNPSNIDFGAGLILENIGIVIGGKLSYPKIPAKQSVK